MQQRGKHAVITGVITVLAAAITSLILAGRLDALLLVWLPSMLIAASTGVWLFFVQHQFEETYWARGNEWNATEAALRGSSHYDLPPVLRWLTANIGIHHVHHASARIPFYRLHKVLKHNPVLRDVSRLGLWQSIRCAGLTLWDEANQRLIFEEFRRLDRGGRCVRQCERRCTTRSTCSSRCARPGGVTTNAAARCLRPEPRPRCCRTGRSSPTRCCRTSSAHGAWSSPAGARRVALRPSASRCSRSSTCRPTPC